MVVITCCIRVNSDRWYRKMLTLLMRNKAFSFIPWNKTLALYKSYLDPGWIEKLLTFWMGLFNGFVEAHASQVSELNKQWKTNCVNIYCLFTNWKRNILSNSTKKIVNRSITNKKKIQLSDQTHKLFTLNFQQLLLLSSEDCFDSFWCRWPCWPLVDVRIGSILTQAVNSDNVYGLVYIFETFRAFSRCRL